MRLCWGWPWAGMWEVEVFEKPRSLFKPGNMNLVLVKLRARNDCFKYILKVLLNGG